MQWLPNERYGDGSDGSLVISGNTTMDNTLTASCTGTSGTKTLSATNTGFAAGKIVWIQQVYGTGAGNHEFNVVSSYTTGTVTLKYALANTYITGAQVFIIKQYTNVTINNGVTLSADQYTTTNNDGMVILLANGFINSIGTITASELGFYGSQVSGPPGLQGQGTGGVVITNSTSANGNGGGGAYSDPQYDAGGGGGNGTVGSAGAGNGGAGGASVGNAALTVACFGGGGGSGLNNQSPQPFGAAGGGGIILIAPTITITGAVRSNGATAVTPGGSNAAGGGGGAGGFILMKGKNITLGSGIVTALAGSGSRNGSGAMGGAGGVGRIHVDYSDSVSGTTSPTLNSTQDNSFSDPAFGFIT